MGSDGIFKGKDSGMNAYIYAESIAPDWEIQKNLNPISFQAVTYPQRASAAVIYGTRSVLCPPLP